MKHTLTTRLLILVLTVNIAVAAAYVYGFLQLGEAQARIGVIESDIAVEEKKVAELNAIRDTLEEFKEYQASVDSHLVAPDGIVEFVEYIEKTAVAAGVTLSVDDLRTEEIPPKALPKLEYLRVTVSAKGSWGGVLRFASLVETLPYQVYIGGLTLETDGTAEKGKGVLWRVGINATVPKLKK
jgi:Tfp pilus assembly protein PilO